MNFHSFAKFYETFTKYVTNSWDTKRVRAHENLRSVAGTTIFITRLHNYFTQRTMKLTTDIKCTNGYKTSREMINFTWEVSISNDAVNSF